MAIQPAPHATTPEFVPIAPARIEDSGLPVARLADLLLKHIYFKSPLSAKDWAAATCLPYQTVTPAIQSLVEQGWVQTIGRMAGPAMSHDFGESLGYLISDPGRLRARDVLARVRFRDQASQPGAEAIDPRFNRVVFLESSASSIYHSLEVFAVKSYGRGLYMHAGYTFAKSIDNGSDALAVLINDSSLAQNPRNLRAERAPSQFDVRQRLVIAHSWEPNWGSGISRPCSR